MDDPLDDAIRWSRYGMECFIGGAVLVIAGWGALYVSNLSTGNASNGPLILNPLYIMPFIAIPLLFAFLTQKTVIDPLKANNLEGMRTKEIIFGILAIFFGLMIGFIIFCYADEKVKSLKSSNGFNR